MMASTNQSNHHDAAKEDTNAAGKCAIKGRHDVFLWTAGIAFIVVFVGVMYGIGEARGWDAASGYTHNNSKTSQERFLPEPYIEEPGVKGRYGLGATSRWYYWKLAPNKVTWYTRLFPWTCYVLHQTLVWSVTFIQQQQKNDLEFSQKYSSSLTKWNIGSFIFNMIFHVLHLVQTHVTYDGLAQDTHVGSPQGAFVMLLSMVILMEYKNRGIVFGWPSLHNTGKISEKLKLNYGPIVLIRKYHGYAFSWATVYTFWYHPMENTLGHALGFCHTWMFMLQGSLVFTKVHLNRYWRLLLETWVLLHSGLVAYQTGAPGQKGASLWPLFVFGFGLVLVLTQIFLLPFWRKIHAAFRFIPITIYLAVTLYMYSWIPDKNGRAWVRIPEIIRIPAFYYLFFLYAWALFYILIKLYGVHFPVDDKSKPTSISKLVALSVFTGSYVIFVAASVMFVSFDVKLELLVCMAILVAIYIAGICVTSMFLSHILPPTKDLERYHEKFQLSNKFGLYNVGLDNGVKIVDCKATPKSKKEKSKIDKEMELAKSKRLAVGELVPQESMLYASVN